ncbi:hypothetical protein, partial [Mycobacteroides abscessus]|uniref:hypothetical protein n=1 Tax=Mycobacteroides abscessus TaxID=36809 RepID=UPI0019CFAA64
MSTWRARWVSVDVAPASGSEQVGRQMSSAGDTNPAESVDCGRARSTLGDLLTVIGEGLRTTGRRQVARSLAALGAPAPEQRNS